MVILRRMHPALSRGDQYVRWSDPNGAGLYAFSRIYQEEEVLVVLNTSGEERGAQMWVDATLSPPGVEFTDSLDASFKVSAFAAEATADKSALAGRKLILKAYQAAVRKKYRFYSFGDALLIL